MLHALTIGMAWLLMGAGGSPTKADDKPQAKPSKPWISKSDEPKAQSFSLTKGAEQLDEATLAWISQQGCASCHTGFPYLMARRSIGDPKAPAMLQVRQFFEDRVAAWDKEGKGKGYLEGYGLVKKTEGITEV